MVVVRIKESIMELALLIIIPIIGLINIIYVLASLVILIETRSIINECNKMWIYIILFLIILLLLTSYYLIKLIRYYVNTDLRSIGYPFYVVNLKSFLIRVIIKQTLLIVYIIIGAIILKNIKNDSICYDIQNNNYRKLYLLSEITFAYSLSLFIVMFIIMGIIYKINLK